MMSLEEAIIHAEEVAELNDNTAYNLEPDNWMVIAQCEKCAAEHRQLAEWLRELAERRKADSCEGCKNNGLWEDEYENGVSCPCLRCARRTKDNYEPERRTE